MKRRRHGSRRGLDDAVWVDENNKKYDSLEDIELESIQSFSLFNFYYKFGKMTQFDKTSILFKLQNYYDSRVFDPSDFADYLTLRKIEFKLYFVPAIAAGLSENLKNLIMIIKLNWRAMKQRAMKGAV